MVKIKSQEVINWILRLFLVIIGLVLAYQLLKKIFGGSWELETVILTLVIANLGYSFYIGNKLSEQKGWSKQFEKRFEALAKDFKERIKH